MNEYLTTPQVAAILNTSRTTVYRLWKEKRLKASAITRSRNGVIPLFDRNVVELFARDYKPRDDGPDGKVA